MVDATATAGRTFGAATPKARTAGALACETSPELYAQFCREAVSAPAQSAEFVSAWLAELAPDPVFVSLSQNGRTVMILALEVVRRGPFRVARFMGGSHANGNFPACLGSWTGNISATELGALMDAVRHARPDVDLVLLERIVPNLQGLTNPLLELPHRPSPNIALAVSLAGGMDAVLERSGSKRKRKKNRAQLRKYEAAGGWRIIEARTPDEVERIWTSFLAMKEHRFRKMGIPNVFADESVRSFFRRLFASALGQPAPAFTLSALEVGGELRAVAGMSHGPRHATCEFGAIAEDELSSTSPGDFLFHASICKACESNLDFYDFGVGDEPYKRDWCDTEVTHFDVTVPLSAKGSGLALAMGALARAKGFVKRNPALWRLTKRLRKQTAGQAQSAEQ